MVYEDLGRNPWETDIDIKWREKAGNWKVIAVANRSVGAPDDQTVKSGDMWEE